MKSLFVALLAATLLPTLGCSKLLAKKTASIDEPLSQSMTSKNGYAVIHYPSSFAGKKIDEAGAQAGRNITLSTDEALVVLAIPNPIADELAEFDRVTFDAQVASYKDMHYVQSHQGAGKCAGRDGIVHDGGMTAMGNGYITMHCSFIEGGRGYAVVYVYPTANPEQKTLLDRMVAAIEFPVPAAK